MKSKRGYKKKKERKKSVCLKRVLKTERANILNKHKLRRVKENEELSMVANGLSINLQRNKKKRKSNKH